MPSLLKIMTGYIITNSEVPMIKNFKYIVYKEGKYFVSQCLNIDVSSFGETMDEAVQNLKEALELYYENGYCPCP